MSNQFELVSEFEPAGDQPQAIAALRERLDAGGRFVTLQGVTGSGKTYTVANVIQQVQRPVLVISHNKTLAAQLYSEFKGFFPKNAVEFFISFYDYYQPEAYIPQTDTFIDKDASINEEIEKLRLAAASALIERRDVIIVASVSCIYGLGSPEDFERMSVSLTCGEQIERNELLHQLVELQYNRNDVAPKRGEFRVSGDTIDVYLAYHDDFLRIELWGDEIDSLSKRDTLTAKVKVELQHSNIFPATQYAMPAERIKSAEDAIMEEMHEQVKKFEREGRLIEAQRIYQRTMYDLEMMREVGYCAGIENYSRHLANRPPGSKPFTLIDYFPEDFLIVIDESHVSLPQIRAMYNGDQARKRTLVDHGFRLPSALDNRPLNFEEFENAINQVIFTSATPGPYELERTDPVQLVVRPTGLLDPEIIVRPLADQIDDLIAEVRACTEKGERVLVTTLTKRTSEDLTDYLRELDIRVKYIHSDIDALERVEILRDLRTGNFDVLVGVNLLREGLDLPEVALVAILDADKEGFLRSETALVQTAGRAARNSDGRVIMYADRLTDSMKRTIDLTDERRIRQDEFNKTHNITPTTVRRAAQESLHRYEEAKETEASLIAESGEDYDITEAIRQLEDEMFQAAADLEFERAAMLRDQIASLKRGEDPALIKSKPKKRRRKSNKNVRY